MIIHFSYIVLFKEVGLMEAESKKQAITLGIRVGLVFITTIIILILAGYYVLSQNVQSLLTDYTINMMHAMNTQGVQLIEAELDKGKNEVLFMSDILEFTDSGNTVEFPDSTAYNDYFRLVYVTLEDTIASDGSGVNIAERLDIDKAFNGEIAVYGPYFNEANEYVVCYSAPVIRNNQIIGVLSIEKDGYRFCDVISSIQFINSGESYIINAEGTDIAVSDKNHIEWVNDQYNSQKLYDMNKDNETKSILDLEINGLEGKSGMGTYYWHDGLCYLVYEPIPSAGWVLLTGLREEEMAAMTRETLFNSIKGPVTAICLFLFLLLTLLISYWSIISLRKNSKINEKLKMIANHDSLTGLQNRNCYNAALERLADQRIQSLACIYIDANGLHEINNHLGHKAGDDMLKAIADTLLAIFPKESLYRIGGDEFVILSVGHNENDIIQAVDLIRTQLNSEYDISIGTAFCDNDCQVEVVINKAEAAMQIDKQHFYQDKGSERRMRSINKQLEQMLLEKQDADTFLTVLAPEFKGVYFVNLNSDTIRHLYIPSYFKEFLEKADNHFSEALLLYADQAVKPEYYHYFEIMCNYTELKKKLNNNDTPEFIYQKMNGDWLKLKILKFSDYSLDQQETLWIFANAESPLN